MAKKKKPDDKLPKQQADKARDAALKQMLKTAPRRHKDEPRRSAVTRRRG